MNAVCGRSFVGRDCFETRLQESGAKLACLYEDGLFTEGQTWRQESIAGTVFDAYVKVTDGVLHPTIRSNSFITAEAMLIVDERDPLCWGM